MMLVYLQFALTKSLIKRQCYPQSLVYLLNWKTIDAVVLKLARLLVIRILLYISTIISFQHIIAYTFIIQNVCEDIEVYTGQSCLATAIFLKTCAQNSVCIQYVLSKRINGLFKQLKALQKVLQLKERVYTLNFLSTNFSILWIVCLEI